MKINLFFVYSIFLIVVTNCYGVSDTITITAEVDKAFITIGDKITYTIKIIHPPEIKIVSSIEPPSVDEFELRDSKDLNSFADENGNTVRGKQFILTIFRLGEYVLEGSSVRYITSSGEEKEIYANNLYITVESIAGEEDIKEDIRGIKDVMPIEPSYLYLLFSIPFIIVVLILAVILYNKVVIAKRGGAKKEVNISLLPHEEAYRELEALPHAKVVHDGKMEKEYYSRLSEIVKHYLARRFDIDTLDRTTVELGSLIKDVLMVDTSRQDIYSLLTMCDMVKFAKFRPQINDILNHYQLTKDIIDQTRQVDETENQIENI